MSADQLLLAYVLILMGGLTLVVIYWELRRRRFRSDASPDKVFRCEGCGFVYTDDADVDRSRCPQCAKLNDAIQF